MKKWENPKKILAGSGLFAYSGSGGMYCGFAGGLYGTGAVAGRSRFGNRNTDRHSDNGKAKGTKNCCGDDKSTGSGSHTGFGIRYLSGRAPIPVPAPDFPDRSRCRWLSRAERSRILPLSAPQTILPICKMLRHCSSRSLPCKAQTWIPFPVQLIVR